MITYVNDLALESAFTNEVKQFLINERTFINKQDNVGMKLPVFTTSQYSFTCLVIVVYPQIHERLNSACITPSCYTKNTSSFVGGSCHSYTGVYRVNTHDLAGVCVLGNDGVNDMPH